MATLMERLAFLQKMPTLMKATADDEAPCPGYLFEEISKISHESPGCCQCLLEYLLERLQVESCHVKLKVLKILLHLCGHSPPHFVTELRRNATFIQEVTVYSGPPDSIHGNALFQKVRVSAQELASVLFGDMMSTGSGVSPTLGMGSECLLQSGMLGFGNSPVRKSSSTLGILDKIQKAAEVVASAVLPPTEHAGIRLHDNHYRPVVAPSAVVEVAVPACTYSVPSRSRKASRRCPGKASGGWEETGSGHSSSHNSSFENEQIIHASLRGSSKSGDTGSHSGASRESGDSVSERVDAVQLGDCGQEMALISRLTTGSKIFLSREESHCFIKECSTLNCEVVVELLCHKLQDPSQTTQMRALCGLACLMCTDLLSLEQIFSVTHVRLTQLSKGTAGPVTNKATKLLRQFEALLGTSMEVTKGDVTTVPESSTTSRSDQPQNPTLTSPLLSAPLDAAVKKPPSISDIQAPSAEQDQEEVCTDSVEESKQKEPTVLENKARTTDPCESSELSVNHPRLSLFSGMELINRGKPVCLVEPVLVEPEPQTGAETFESIDMVMEKSSERTAEPSSSSSCEQVSAFSFLNL
ncbi:AP-4 complex accessory subunit Tepsin isoform X2 [Ictalurus furcatus]|uniref:AP-4 complex accessory subunit Tepsin isoform X2 n=1 Tax=Ictalurus furcatus TaxID=66913 RepID=UPI002350ADF4|nr:AP-4 complex accessory subunit Tepsin isoform X2 [Ictalurus furcatus]